MRTKPFLVCRSCGGQIEIGTKNHVEGRQVCRKCLDEKKINEDAYLRTLYIRRSINVQRNILSNTN